MGGNGASSATAKVQTIYEQNRQMFIKAAERAETGFQSVHKVNSGRTARAAAGLVGTERGFSLVESDELGRLGRIVDRANAGGFKSTLSEIEQLLEPGLGNMPMHMTGSEWSAAKSWAQDAVGNLAAKGYTVEEIAAGLAYQRYLQRV